MWNVGRENIMAINVMIFGGGGYSAVQVYFSLKHSLRFHPIMAGSYDNHASYISNDAIIDLPFTNDPSFITRLNDCIEEHNIKFIIPTHDSAALTLAENQSVIQAVVVSSCSETAKICRHKSLTYKTLAGLGFVPNVYSYDSIPAFPIFAKDDEGQGGRNACLISNQSELSKIKDTPINYVLCEYLPGKEVTIDCFTDRHGTLRFMQPRYRERIINGITARTSNAEITDEFRYIVNSIAERISFRGYWFVQCKQDIHGKYKLMEISTRFAGTFDLSKSLDVNLPLLALCDFSGMDIDITPNKYKISLDKTYIDRYKIDYHYKRVYIDFDDTLVFHREKYNTEAMRFIFQCLNKGIQLVLITKHEYNLDETMQKIKLSKDVFDEIIEVPLDRDKYEYMDNNIPSIFIDNAYTERKKVKEHLSMPTFDVSNFDCLIDWADD